MNFGARREEKTDADVAPCSLYHFATWKPESQPGSVSCIPTHFVGKTAEKWDS